MRLASAAAALACVAALAGPLADPARAQGGGPAVTVYSSLPLSGVSAPTARAIANGARLALEQAGGRAGEVSVRYVSLDDATAQFGSWTPEAEARPSARSYRELARRVRRSRARCVTYGGITANNAAQVFRDLVRGVPGVRLFGADGLLEEAFTDPARAACRRASRGACG